MWHIDDVIKTNNIETTLKAWLTTPEFTQRFRRLIDAPKEQKFLSEMVGSPIVVSSNCQTFGLASALQALLPDEIVLPFPIVKNWTIEEQETLARLLSKASAWLTIDIDHTIELIDKQYWQQTFLERHSLHISNPSLQIKIVPAIIFSGFHPDMCYARNEASGKLTSTTYNSAIAVWAYQHGLAVDKAAKLFNARTFEQLGYFERWNLSIKNLERRFENTALDFAAFYRHIKRQGVFMYSFNHPTVDTLLWIAKAVARNMGAKSGVLDAAFYLPDVMRSTVWPIYPELADYLSLEGGSYVWKIEGDYFYGLEAYIAHSFESYGRQNISPENIRHHDMDISLLDHVLLPQLH